MIAKEGSIRFKMLVEYLGCLIEDEGIEGGRPTEDMNVIFEAFLGDVAEVFSDNRSKPPVQGH